MIPAGFPRAALFVSILLAAACGEEARHDDASPDDAPPEAVRADAPPPAGLPPAPPAPDPIAMTFPPSLSPPAVRVRNAGDDRREAWSDLGRGAGGLALPPGMEVMLAWDHGSEPDLSVVSAIPPGTTWEIDLSATLVTDAGLAPLADPSLTSGPSGLNLNHTRITDEAISYIRAADTIEKLGLVQTSVTAQGVQTLAALPRLRRLWLNHLPVDDRTLAAFAAAETPPARLEWLLLENTSVTDAGMESVANLRALKLLVLKDTTITNTGVARLAGLRSLEILSLEGTRVTGPGLLPLSGVTGLRELWLSGTGLSSADARPLAEALPSCRIIFD